MNKTAIDGSFLTAQAKKLGISLDKTTVDKFSVYANMLIDWNERMNLTAITRPDEIVCKHFADSLSILSLLPEGVSSLIDVGTGAGFPGVPIAIMRPDIKVTLLDSTNKRIMFLESLCAAIGVNAALLHDRAELAARKSEHRAAYDVSTARAVAALPVLCEYCIPFLKTGGRFIAMKGLDGENEAAVSADALRLLGGTVREVHTVEGIGGEGTNIEPMHRQLIWIEKTGATPDKYPRSSAKIASNPL